MECSVALQILPMDAADDREVCRVVDAVIEYIATCDVSFFVGPFETTIEADFDTCMEVLKQSQLIALESGSHHVMCYAKVDSKNEGKLLTTEQKVSKYLKRNTLIADE